MDGAIDANELAELLEKFSENEGIRDDFTNEALESLSAFDLYNKKVEVIPTLLNPFLQKIGLASLVGTSDSGKSTFLRQLSLSIALKMDNFLGFKIESDSNKVIYVSTEDDSNAVGFSIKKQIDYLLQGNKEIETGLLNNLEFVFETENLLMKLSEKLKKQSVDLIIIDSFTDVFTKELNANTQVRQFLNDYDRLAKKHGCLILFLHHIGKNTLKNAPSKDSIIGSQAFEAKMRVVLELRPNRYNDSQKDLWVLKGNFLETKFKSKSFVLEINNNLIFKLTGERSNKGLNAKSTNPLLKEKIIGLKSKGLSIRKIEEELKNTEFQISKSSIAEILKSKN
ncbi:MAG: AAA family ATPase [Flavobacterium sp.]